MKTGGLLHTWGDFPVIFFVIYLVQVKKQIERSSAFAYLQGFLENMFDGILKVY